MAPQPDRQFLLIDGDDTLWENNVYFEQAIEAFIDFLGHSSMTREQVRAALAAVDNETAADTSRASVKERPLHPAPTWMIGTSPRSDITPALQAGLNAVFIPHEHTWRLEKEEVGPADGRLLILQAFGELRAHF